MEKVTHRTKPFDTKGSIQKASGKKASEKKSSFDAGSTVYHWRTALERVNVIRTGLSYDAIEVINKKLNIPVKSVLALVGIPQTTYNKKKNAQLLLDSRSSELLLLMNELVDYGLEVFNQEVDKFQRWLKKPNISLGGNAPESMLDTTTGIQEVRFCLNRLEFGQLA